MTEKDKHVSLEKDETQKEEVVVEMPKLEDKKVEFSESDFT